MNLIKYLTFNFTDDALRVYAGYVHFFNLHSEFKWGTCFTRRRRNVPAENGTCVIHF